MTYCKILLKYLSGITGKIRNDYVHNISHMRYLLKDMSRIIRLVYTMVSLMVSINVSAFSGKAAGT